MFKRTILLVITLTVLFFISGCGPTIYMSPEFESYRSSHETAAILPFDVIIASKKLPKEFTPEMILKAEKSEGYSFQQELYMAFLIKKAKKGYTISFQEVDQTNALIAKSNISYIDIPEYSNEELAQILGVDVIITGNIYRSRPMSEATAFVLGAITGIWGSTNKVNIEMRIHDGSTDKIIWNLEHSVSGSVGSSTKEMVESLFKKVSKKFPYTIPDKKY